MSSGTKNLPKLPTDFLIIGNYEMTFIYIILMLLGLILLGVILFLIIPLKYPLPTESDYSHHSFPWWYIYYGHKYLQPIKRAEKGSGTEDYFRNMTFKFDDSPLEDSEEITIKATGDLMCRRDLVEEGSVHLWDEIGDLMFSGDIVTANLEFAINPDWIIEETVRYSVPPSYAKPLLGDQRFGHFNLLSLANNHINDSLTQGIISTCDHLDLKQITFTGASRTREEQDQFPLLELKGAKIAVLGYTFSTNNLPLEKDFSFGTNLVRFNALNDEDYDPSLILHHIDLAKQRGADYIISHHHWGIEFEYYPPARLIKRAEQLFEAGLDLIIGHHPHGLYPTQHYQTKDGRDCLCFYSLGSITSYALPFRMHKLSAIAEVILETGTNDKGYRVVRPSRLSLNPIYYSRFKGAQGLEQRLLPLKPTLAAIEAGERPEYIKPGEVSKLTYINSEFDNTFAQNLPK